MSVRRPRPAALTAPSLAPPGWQRGGHEEYLSQCHTPGTRGLWCGNWLWSSQAPKVMLVPLLQRLPNSSPKWKCNLDYDSTHQTYGQPLGLRKMAATAQGSQPGRPGLPPPRAHRCFLFFFRGGVSTSSAGAGAMTLDSLTRNSYTWQEAQPHSMRTVCVSNQSPAHSHTLLCPVALLRLLSIQVTSQSRSVMSSCWRPHGLNSPWILQARILEWVALPLSRGSSWPRDGTQVSRIAGFFTSLATREAQESQGYI